MDRGRRLAPGDVVLVRLPEQQPPGHEQAGLRPALVVAVPERLSRPRFPVVLVAPFTTDRGQLWADASPALYPRVPAGPGGLPGDSIALIDQLRAVDVDRIAGQVGSVPPETLETVRATLRTLLALS